MRPRPHHLRVLTRRIAAVPVAGDHRDVQVLDQWIEETALEFLIGYRVRTDYVKVRATRITSVDQRRGTGIVIPKTVPSLRPVGGPSRQHCMAEHAEPQREIYRCCAFATISGCVTGRRPVARRR
jgi:hypothetical protein